MNNNAEFMPLKINPVVANPEAVRREDLAARFLEACRLRAEIRAVPVEQLQLVEPRPLSSWLRSDKIARELGVRFTPVSEILEQYARNLGA